MSTLTTCITVLLTVIFPAISSHGEIPLADLSLNQLEQRLAEIDTELDQLAHYSLRSGIGAIGYRSLPHQTPEQPEWIEIELEKEIPINEIMLVPAIRRDSENGFQADGFPAVFRIWIGTDNNRAGSLLGEYRSADGILPRIAPIVIPAKDAVASWVRIEATRLSARAFDNNYIFQLSEVLVFSGMENVALRQLVNVSSSYLERGDSSWNKRFLVDGHTPYLMDAAQGLQSVAYVSPHGLKPTMVIDLREAFPLSRIHLHAVDQSDTVPQAHAGELGIPTHLRIEGASLPDFSDKKILMENRLKSVNDTGPIMMWSIPETSCRYVRLSDASTSTPFRIGFAEIELFSNDRNVARGKPVSSDLPASFKNPTRSLAALTDGRNLYGNILSIRGWLNELARRHDLETERPLIVDELNLRYARQKTSLNRVSWLAGLLAAGTVIIVLIEKVIRQRAVFRTRERIAANLHDELGANLHAIGLFGDLAKHEVEEADARGQWSKLVSYVEEVRALTKETGATARYCTNLLEANGLFEDVVEEMQRISNRLLADLHHNFLVENEEILQHLKPRQRIDLYLFYKECLTNIIRHSGATDVSTHITSGNNKITLEVEDNGRGLADSGKIAIPRSLKRRAHLLGAHLSCKIPETGGTRIKLTFRSRRGLRKLNHEQ